MASGAAPAIPVARKAVTFSFCHTARSSSTRIATFVSNFTVTSFIPRPSPAWSGSSFLAEPVASVGLLIRSTGAMLSHIFPGVSLSGCDAAAHGVLAGGLLETQVRNAQGLIAGRALAAFAAAIQIGPATGDDISATQEKQRAAL